MGSWSGNDPPLAFSIPQWVQTLQNVPAACVDNALSQGDLSDSVAAGRSLVLKQVTLCA